MHCNSSDKISVTVAQFTLCTLDAQYNLSQHNTTMASVIKYF